MDCHFSDDLKESYTGVYAEIVGPASGHVIAPRRVVKKEAVKGPALNTPGLGVQLLTAGTAACVADIITFPLDTTKVRLQVNMTGQEQLKVC